MRDIHLDLPEKIGFMLEPARYKAAYGGRGSGKSWGFARAALVYALERRRRILCARELQLSIQDSVHKLLKEQIEALGVASDFEVLQTAIRGRNGSEFIFSGLRSNITKIKSMEGVDVCWVEEAEVVSEDSWKVLIPTIRKPGSEIWASFNTGEETDPAYQRFVAHPPPGARVVEINSEDNPWLPEELRREREYLYSVDPEAAANVWGGKPRRNNNANVLRGRYVVEPFEPQEDWSGPYYGADWGFANDPTVLVREWVHGRTLYIEHEAYGLGIDIDDTPELFKRVPESQLHVIRADSARPETISHMRRHGFERMEGAIKGPGSIEDGVEHLRSYERIVIHPRCTLAKQQARLWSYKVDRLTGDVMPVLVDKHNDVWDATRYALEPIIRASNAGDLDADPDAVATGYTWGIDEAGDDDE